ncbi:MAG: GNAT family N-acetyltransferase [Anaerolineales bacterium]|jgi:ribosomal protein S18 acetylase RimI-like enzyme
MTAAPRLPEVAIRSARREEAELAAVLLYESVKGMGDYMFGCEARWSVPETLAELFRSRQNRLSHEYASLAEVEGQVAGLLMSYPGKAVPPLDLQTGRTLMGFFSLGALLRMAWRSLGLSGTEALRGEYYISNLAVLPTERGRGIGSRLLAFAEGQARAAGFTRLSLCVDMDNTGAQRLYRRMGYQVVRTQYYPRHAAQAGRGYLRMVKPLDSQPAS